MGARQSSHDMTKSASGGGSSSGSLSGQAALFSTAHAHSPFSRRHSPDVASSSLSAQKALPLLEREAMSPMARSSNLMTGFNIINNYVGMVLLSMHYTFAETGWLGMLALAVLTAFGAWTGELIVLSYQTIAAEGVSVPSYAQIGERCMGNFGKWLVLWSSILETFFAILCMEIIIWSNAALLLPNVPLEWVIAGCVLLSFPTNWLRDFSLLSFLSAFGIGCVLLIIAVVVYQVVMRASGIEDVPSAHHGFATTELAVPSGLPMASSIMLAGLTGHVGLPPMYAEMKTPSGFRPTLYLSFLVMFLMYAVVASCGYLLYGVDSSVLITQDMSEAGAKSSVVGQVLIQLVDVGITFKLFCSVPMCVVVLVDIAQNLYLENTGSILSESASDAVRLALWAASILSSLAVYGWLKYVTALIGINSMLISVLLPILFFIILHAKQMSPATKLVYFVLVAISCVITLVICYIDVLEFLESLDDLEGGGGDEGVQ